MAGMAGREMAEMGGREMPGMGARGFLGGGMSSSMTTAELGSKGPVYHSYPFGQNLEGMRAQMFSEMAGRMNPRMAERMASFANGMEGAVPEMGGRPMMQG